MRKNKSQRLFQSLRSLRFKKNRSADDGAKKSGRVVLLETHNVTKPVQVTEPKQMKVVKAETRNAQQKPVALQEEPTCYVRCPLGLEAGNTMIVISPCGTHKFPVKIPTGIVCGQEFQVKLPQQQQQQQQDKQEGGLDYVFRVVDEFLTPTPSFEEGEQPQQEAAPKATTTSTETKSEDFGSVLDSFFTPVPEVKAYFHAAQA